MPTATLLDARDDTEALDEDHEDHEGNECLLCGGPLVSLGILGCQHHLRCRNCGMMFSRPLPNCGD